MRRFSLQLTLFVAVASVTGLEEARAQEFAWAGQVDATTGGSATHVAVDGSGDVLITGGFAGTADFDPGPGTYNITAAGDYADAFVWKLDTAGSLVWAKTMGGTRTTSGRAIAVDPSGNIYTAGSFYGTADFDPGPGTYNMTAVSYFDTYVSKLDAVGNFVWAKQIAGGTGSQVYAMNLALDPSGNLYTVGYFFHAADFDPGPGTHTLTAVGSSDVFVLKLDNSGNFVWVDQLGGRFREEAYGIAVDSIGNVYTVGNFEDRVDFDPGPSTYSMISYSFSDSFVWKLNAGGSLVWAKQLEGGTYQMGAYGYGVAVSASGDANVVGVFSNIVDFDPGPASHLLVSGDNPSAFVLKLNTNGNFVWAEQLSGGSTGRALANDVAIDLTGNIYAVGDFSSGPVDFNPGTVTYNLTPAGDQDAFIAKLDSAGNFVWAGGLGGTSADYGEGVAVDKSGNVYSTGYFSGTADFNPGPGTFDLTSAASHDPFVSKLAQTPAPTFTDKTTFAWRSLFGETAYNLYRSDIAVPGTFFCLASHLSGASATDVAEPAVGTLYAYLVTAVDAAGQEGTMGSEEVNGNPTSERPNSNPCP